MRDSTGPSAFEQLFHDHYAGLCAFAHTYVREWAIAEELVGDVFFALWQRRDSLDPAQNLKAYLYTAARNAALSHLRRRGLADQIDEADARDVAGTVQPADAELAYHELAHAVDAAVAELPARAREVFTLSREGGLSYAEIAEMLAISIKTVEASMTRALRILRERLGPYMERD